MMTDSKHTPEPLRQLLDKLINGGTIKNVESSTHVNPNESTIVYRVKFADDEIIFFELPQVEGGNS